MFSTKHQSVQINVNGFKLIYNQNNIQVRVNENTRLVNVLVNGKTINLIANSIVTVFENIIPSKYCPSTNVYQNIRQDGEAWIEYNGKYQIFSLISLNNVEVWQSITYSY